MSTSTFFVSTSTLDAFYAYVLNIVYGYIVSALTDGGVFLFGVVMTLIAIVIWLGWNKLRHIFG